MDPVHVRYVHPFAEGAARARTKETAMIIRHQSAVRHATAPGAGVPALPDDVAAAAQAALAAGVDAADIVSAIGALVEALSSGAPPMAPASGAGMARALGLSAATMRTMRATLQREPTTADVRKFTATRSAIARRNR